LLAKQYHHPFYLDFFLLDKKDGGGGGIETASSSSIDKASTYLVYLLVLCRKLR